MPECFIQTSDRSDGGLNYPHCRGLECFLTASLIHFTHRWSEKWSIFACLCWWTIEQKWRQSSSELCLGKENWLLGRNLLFSGNLRLAYPLYEPQPWTSNWRPRAIRCIRGLGDAVPIRTCPIIQVPLSRTTFHTSLHINLARPHTIHREPSGILYINLKKCKYHVCGAENMAWLVRSNAF